jgi:DNA mismatch repair protein MutS2
VESLPSPAGSSLGDLEWPLLLEAIASRTVSALGRAEVLALLPAAAPEQARLRQTTLAELLELTSIGVRLPVGDVSDTTDTLERLRRGGGAAGAELALVARVLRTALGLMRFGEAHVEVAPTLARVLSVEPGLGRLSASLGQAISDDGQILDQASPALADARGSVRSLRRRVQTRIQELIARYKDVLQDGYFAERDGRYVLPVRSDAEYRLEGFVLGSSASGSTLYVEPREIATLGHELRLAEARAEREEGIVLAQLAAELEPWVDAALGAQEVCALADLLSAVTSLSKDTSARVVPLDEEAIVDLRAVRHPLLAAAGIQVVENDLFLQAGRGLVVSGPNAGGKTVLLKSLGLMALMQATGLPLPVAAGSRVGFFRCVLADIGDDQSLSRSLSTFSGHVERVCAFLAASDSQTLVLLDELMGGTDPNEGAVLAIATLDEFVRRGAAVLVTTHYEALKDHALGKAHLDSAAVGFDFAEMKPTFKVDMGRPGASSALLVAERHGLPRQLVLAAESLLPEVEARLRQDRIQIEQLRADLEVQKRQLGEATREQERSTRRLDEERRRTEEARRRDLGKETDELRVAVREARTELRQLRTRLRGGDGANLAEVERDIDRVSQKVTLGSDVDRELRGGAPAGPALSPDELVSRLQPGVRIRLRGFAGEGEVLEPPRKGKVSVRVGAMKLSAALGDLELCTTPVAKAAPTPRRKEAPASAAVELSPPVRSQDAILDLRGKRVEVSLDDLDGFIDELLQRQEEGGYVLHGHGTGAMKEAVRNHLAGHACVRHSRGAERDEGGDAFTVFWLAV